MPKLEVKNLKKEFDLGVSGKYLLFENISFVFEEGESFLSLLAPFGAGKSTLLSIIAGLEKPTGGNVYFNNAVYDHPDGKIIYIPEQASSLPWLNVTENIKTGIDASVFSSRNDTHVDEIIKLIGLTGYENHYPDDMSRGFRFRIAIGRAISLNPAFILIDDSLRGFDKATKKELFEMLKDINNRTGIKFLIASSDVSTVVRLSDRILILKGKPVELAGEFRIGENRDKDSLLKFISAIENIFQNDLSNDSIDFTI